MISFIDQFLNIPHSSVAMVILFSAVEERRRDRCNGMPQCTRKQARAAAYILNTTMQGAGPAGVGQDHVQQLLLTLHSFHYGVCIEKRNT